MKKLNHLVTLLTLLFVVLMPTYLLAAAAGDSVCTQSLKNYPTTSSTPLVRELTFTCTADSTDGSFLAMVFSQTHLDKLVGFYLYKLVTNPGTTAPTDNWDFTITDADGLDVLGGSGADRHTTTSTMLAPKLNSTTYFAQPALGPWTLNITGNTTNSAIIVIKTIFVK